MNSLSAALKAREFVRAIGANKIPCPVESYVDHIGAELRVDHDLSDDESGFTIQHAGRIQICVNGNHRPQRQRFTICHELGHVVLGLPTEHQNGSWWSYRARPEYEILCDIFASELLLPFHLFQPQLTSEILGFGEIERLASDFEASLPCTASRYAALIDVPCAYVLSERGRVRFVERSAKLRQIGVWIPHRFLLPPKSISSRLREGNAAAELTEISADEWFEDWGSEFSVLEDARHLERWDQTLSLLWLDDDICELEEDHTRPSGHRHTENLGLEELDGVLPWPGRRRRR